MLCFTPYVLHALCFTHYASCTMLRTILHALFFTYYVLVLCENESIVWVVWEVCVCICVLVFGYASGSQCVRGIATCTRDIVLNSLVIALLYLSTSWVKKPQISRGVERRGAIFNLSSRSSVIQAKQIYIILEVNSTSEKLSTFQYFIHLFIFANIAWSISQNRFKCLS